MPRPPIHLSSAESTAVAAMATTDGGDDTQDEVRRTFLKPKVSPDEALSILLDLYIADGFDGDAKVKVPRAEVIRELDSYDDVNYLVKVDGEKALLKIHNGVESEEYIAEHTRKGEKLDGSASHIDLHTAIYAHLANPQYNVTTAKTIPPTTSNNEECVCIRELPVVSSEHSPHQLVIRLQTFVHGTPLSDIKWFPIETLVDCGACLGRLCHAFDELAASDSLALETSKTYSAWDGRNLSDMKPYVSHIDDVDRRKLVSGIIEAFEKTIIEGKESDKFRMGINHADFNDANIVSARIAVQICHVLHQTNRQTISIPNRLSAMK